MTIRKRGSTYTCIVRVAGRQPQYRTFASKREAREWGQALEVAIKTGKVDSVESSRSTFASILHTRYLTHVLPLRRQDGMKSADGFERELEMWCDKLGPYKLAEVTPQALGRIVEELRGKVKPATVRRKLAALSSFFNWCVLPEVGLLQRNPVKDVTKPKEPKGRTRFLSDDERNRLIAACSADTAHPHFYPLVFTAIYTGMRQTELLTLTWLDVDLSDGWALVRDSKNGEQRRVPLCQPVIGVLKEWRKANPFASVESRVFGVDYFDHGLWYKILDAAQLSDFRFHDCRHSAASYMAMSGMPILDIAKVLGHKTLAMSFRYAHLTADSTRAGLERMSEKFG